MIPTYNCARYLRETLTHVLAQDPGPDVMEIQVVDDHSTADAPDAVVRELGWGRVTFFRHPARVGIIRNFETCLRRSTGRLIHLLHGDDYVLDGFYAAMAHALASDPAIGAAFCRHFFLTDQDHSQALSPLEQSQSGVLENWLERIASEQRIMAPSIVVRREVYERVGGFDARLSCSEDWEMWVRIAAQYPVWYEVRPLAVYRMHAASNTGRHFHNADHLRYTRMAIGIFTAYLAPPLAATVGRKARETYALAALDTASTLLQDRQIGAALAHGREAVRFSRSRRVLRRLIGLLVRGLLFWTRRTRPGRGAAR